MTSRWVASLRALGLAITSLYVASCGGGSVAPVDGSAPEVSGPDVKSHHDGSAEGGSGGEGGHCAVAITAVVPTMEGSVLSSDHQIYCGYGGSCQGCYNLGDVVTLNEVRSVEYLFKGWGGACAAAGVSPTCVLTVAGPATVSVMYEVPPLIPLTVMVSGGTGNLVTSSPAGITTMGTETVSFPEGSGVTLNAIPNTTTSQKFLKWTGGQCGVGLGASKCKCTLGIGATADTETATFGPCSGYGYCACPP